MRFILSFSLLMFVYTNSLHATTVMIRVKINEKLENTPEFQAWTEMSPVINTASDNVYAPIVFLTGLVNTEDTIPILNRSINCNRYGFDQEHTWTMQNSSLTLTNEENDIPLKIIATHEDGSQLSTVVKPNKSNELAFPKAGSYKLRIWPRMEEVLHVLVTKTNYVTSVDKFNSIRLNNLPPGKAVVNIWYAGKIIHSSPIEIPDTGTIRTTITVGENPGNENQPTGTIKKKRKIIDGNSLTRSNSK